MKKIMIIGLVLVLLFACSNAVDEDMNNDDKVIENKDEVKGEFQRSKGVYTTFLCTSGIQKEMLVEGELTKTKSHIYAEYLNSASKIKEVTMIYEYESAPQSFIDEIVAEADGMRKKTTIVPVVRPYENDDNTTDIVYDTRYKFLETSKDKMLESKVISPADYELMSDASALYDYAQNHLKMSCEFDVYQQGFKHSIIMKKHEK